MPLVQLKNGKSDWSDIKDAAYFIWKSSELPSIHDVGSQIRRDTGDPNLSVCEFYTGVNVTRKVVLVKHQVRVFIALEGSREDEIVKNMWVREMGSNWWDILYAVRINGDEVHSFYMEMWNNMKWKVLEELERVLWKMVGDDVIPQNLIIAGLLHGWRG
jgi:hypothetical protein